MDGTRFRLLAGYTGVVLGLALGGRGVLAEVPRKWTHDLSVTLRFRPSTKPPRKPLSGPPAPRPMVFGGKVLEVHPKQHSFLLSCSSSRKYARVRIVHHVNTRWSGVPLEGRALRQGEPVQVTALPAGDAFRAVNVVVLNPSVKPGGRSAAAP